MGRGGSQKILLDVMVDCHYTSKKICDCHFTSIFFTFRRLKSYEDSNQYQESFDVYVQALISQCLDPDFLVEVIRDQGTYFDICLAPLVPYDIVSLPPTVGQIGPNWNEMFNIYLHITTEVLK